VRILHVLGGLDRGGAETSLLRSLRHIDRTRYHFDFLVHTEKPCAYDDEARSLGARIFPCLSPPKPVQYARNFFRILREHGPYDCVHSHVHHFSGYVLTLARLGGVGKRIAHSRTDTRALESSATLRRSLYLASMKALLRMNATAGLAVSRKAAESLFGKDWGSDIRWQVCYSGIELDAYTRSVDRVEIRKELQIAPDAFVIGHVGRFVKEKNHLFLLEIAKRVFAQRPNACFVLVGDGPLKEEMRTRVEQAGLMKQILFLGLRDDIPRLMAMMDGFIFPSLYEGLPVVLLEAQAAGLPCVISDSITDETDIVAGLVRRLSLSDPVSVWADAILRVGRPKILGSDVAIRSYGMEAAVERLCNVYESK
jgi:glycosyltransferase involved in cell wall biosynthesis